MDAPQILEKTRQQLIQRLLEKKKDIDRQLEQLGHREKPRTNPRGMAMASDPMNAVLTSSTE